MSIPMIVPGLHGSGPAHWQTWLQARMPVCRRVEQPDWQTPDLARWTAVVNREVLLQCRPVLLIAHSFGCLAAVNAAMRLGNRVSALLLVAPADPHHFGLMDSSLLEELLVPATVVGSRNDPWMTFARTRLFADRWGGRLVDLGQSGHINVASGHGPWPLALSLLSELVSDTGRNVAPLSRQQQVEITI